MPDDSSRPILVADYDLTRRWVIARALREQGHLVIEVGDAAAAEEALAERDCRLAFVAVLLSGGDGFELCHRWTARGLRVVLVANDFRASETWRAQARDAGAVALLSSTVDRDQLATLVHELTG